MECCLLQVIEAEEQLGGYDCVCFKGNMGGATCWEEQGDVSLFVSVRGGQGLANIRP